ncbi:membrane protein FtsH1 [Cardiosporidium cionae]|uniref:Membrane protein FtsH1 n=1 Tax=Cardiosporidium cionae TaxID=476202 RepID=A0ABQ7JB43_9APIC|nr:membrane protein FtsH1 [Cardiosporidium cionae]|eukprot:KAF8821178.1 membrane protein FtsH1 [Cardiosporidium cionae]
MSSLNCLSRVNDVYSDTVLISHGSDSRITNETTPLIPPPLPNSEIRNRSYNHAANRSNTVSYFSTPRPYSCFTWTLAFIIGISCGVALWPLVVTMLTYRYVSTPHDLYHNSTGVGQSASRNANTANGFVHSTPVRFKDIAGMGEAKAELTEFVHFLQNPEPYVRLGARLPKGVLLVGPPGSGKTMLANAVATEAGLPYLFMSGSEFVEIYVGQGARRVRQLFQVARSISPCIIFIDELDAVGGRRHSGASSGSHREHDQTLNQLLVELDGFNSSSGVMVMAATNRIDSLDPALLRPGRFDRIVRVSLPDIAGRKAILRLYLSRIPFTQTDSVVHALAKMTAGFSGADLENLVNEAALLAAHTGKETITEVELSEARDKVSMGPQRRSLVIPEKQRILTAYHESGHALVAFYLQPETDPIHKISIVSRGSALGFVEQIPPEDRFGHARGQLEARLAVSMGGRAAEQLVFGKSRISNGASSDILVATAIAYKMVSEWGMSDKVGPLNYKVHYGSYSSDGRELSNKMSSVIEEEVRELVFAAQRKAETILRKHRSQLDLLAQLLLEKETISGEELDGILSLNSTQECLRNSMLRFFKGNPFINRKHDSTKPQKSTKNVTYDAENDLKQVQKGDINSTLPLDKQAIIDISLINQGTPIKQRYEDDKTSISTPFLRRYRFSFGLKRLWGLFSQFLQKR